MQSLVCLAVYSCQRDVGLLAAALLAIELSFGQYFLTIGEGLQLSRIFADMTAMQTLCVIEAQNKYIWFNLFPKTDF
jgi:hypothetical protein